MKTILIKTTIPEGYQLLPIFIQSTDNFDVKQIAEYEIIEPPTDEIIEKQVAKSSEKNAHNSYDEGYYDGIEWVLKQLGL